MENRIREKIDLFVKAFIEETGLPGVAVGVVEENQGAYAKGFGVISVETKEPVTENTLFHMASVSKPFVAVGIMQLAEQRRLELNDVVIKHLPYFKVKGEGYETITIGEMLSHISGMPDVYDYEWDKPQYDEGALERHVRNGAKLELIEGQRGKFKYSNLAFEVLGDLISKVSGMSFEDYMRKNILEPVGMEESTFFYKEAEVEHLATPHVLDLRSSYSARVSEVFPYNRRHAPSSTLCSNLTDMFRWARVNLSKGKIDGVKILKEESYLELFKEAAPTGRQGHLSHIGLSWFLGEFKGNRVASHSGMDTGFQSNFILLPEKGMGLVWMTNNDFTPMKMFTEGLLNILLGYEEETKYSLALTLLKSMLEGGLEGAEEKYSFIKESCRDKYYSEEHEFNGLAYRLLGENKVKGAAWLLEFGIREFPMAANLYDSLGEMYLKNNDRELAVKNYERAVELNPKNKAAAVLLEELRSK